MKYILFKKLFLALLICFVFLISFISNSLALEKCMNAKEVGKTFGTTPFDADKFKKGDRKIRAAMAYSLIESRKYIGKSFKQVIEDLGAPDGYFSNDAIPAYLLNESGDKSPVIWQIVFIPNKSWEKVKELKICEN